MRDCGRFDYVIVGAGSAGCVLANRLSADQQARVLLLEAGGRDWHPWIHIPVGYLYTRNSPRLGWGLRTQPEKHLDGRALDYPRGRVLGGSSAINGMVYVRGHAKDYDTWRQLGNVGWSWDDVLPYFRKSEKYAGGETAAHGANGEWHVEERRDPWEILEVIRDACASLGIPRTADFNTGESEGTGYYQINQHNGWRASAATAFLHPVRRRPNLVVMTGAEARRIRFEGRRAVGVEFDVRGAAGFAGAHEIILAAGAIGSPLVLQASGVGPGGLLQDRDIPVVYDSAGVGENLQDHLQIRIAFKVDSATMNERVSRRAGRGLMALEYALFRTGPLTMPPSQLGGFVHSDPSKDAPDLQFFVQMGSLDASGAFHDFPAVTMAVCHLRPQSCGHVRLGAGGIGATPSIQPCYLDAAEDRRAMVTGVRLARKIFAAPEMKRFSAREFVPGPAYQTDEQIEKAVAQTASSIFHAAGTCKMGHDPLAVVDDRLKVRGIGGVRVADASVMPLIISANTNAAVVMIAEKAADLIRADSRGARP